MNKKATMIGIGMNGAGTLTSSALEAVKNADVLIGAERMTSPFSELKKPVFNAYKYDEITEFIRTSKYCDYAVLMSGDCGFFSGCTKLRELLGEYTVSIICGIPSPVYFSSKLGMPWSDWHFVSLHGENANIVRNICAYEKTFFLLGGSITPSDICKRLCEYGMGNVSVHIGEDLAYENERIISDTAENLQDIHIGNLCVLLAINSDFEKVKRIGIPDDGFIRGNVPMTKSEVRAVCISKLGISEDSICWDIGCGTGSVSVEMAIQSTNGMVYALDKSEEAVLLTEKNRIRYGCDNIEIIHKDAEDIIADLPSPNCVFIGGSGGKLDIMIRTAYSKNPGVTIVVTAVSLETLHTAVSVFKELGIKTETVQLAVTRTKKAGTHTMLNAENPIFIIKGSAE